MTVSAARDHVADASPSIVVAHATPLYLGGFAALLTAHGYRVVGTASRAREALSQAALLQPDILLLDLGLPDLAPRETCPTVRSVRPETAVVLLWSRGDEDAVVAALEAGARGCLQRNADLDALLEVLARVQAGRRSLDACAADLVLERLSAHRGAARMTLTARERAVLRHVAHGLTNAEIARALHLSRHTVKEYLSNAMRKLNARGRAHAVHEASRRGLIATDARPSVPVSEPDRVVSGAR